MSDDNASQGEDLEARARQYNSNLLRLIDAVGDLLAGSAALLARLRQILSSDQPPEGSTSEPPADPPPPDRQQGP